MNTAERSRMILGLRSRGWSDTKIEDFILWVETGEQQHKPTGNDRKDIQKAMAYGLILTFKENTEKSYTYEEIEKLIEAYVSGLEQ